MRSFRVIQVVLQRDDIVLWEVGRGRFEARKMSCEDRGRDGRDPEEAQSLLGATRGQRAQEGLSPGTCTGHVALMTP